MSKYPKLYLSTAALYVTGAAIAYVLASSPACCARNNHSTSYQQKENTNMLQYGHIDGKALKNLIDTKVTMVILDARNQQWDDGRRVPSAKSLPFDSSTELFAKAAPHKNALVVVYCGSHQCPAGKTLIERMIAEGYTHILEYPGGMKEWGDEINYPVERN